MRREDVTAHGGLTVEEAVRLAAVAHAEQVYHHPDTGPQPYIMHPWRVSLQVSERARIAALLHDVLEDSNMSLPEDRMLAVNVHAVMDLTRAENETYDEYIGRLLRATGAAGEIAREVKIADIRENMRCIRPGHFAYNWEKYKNALSLLVAVSE